MRTWHVAAAALATACGSDPKLDLAIKHPAKYEITRTSVTVYKGQDLTCDQIMLGDLTADQLVSLTTDDIDATNGGSLSLDRLGGKSIVVRGFNKDERLATAGCQDIGEIAGDDKVDITTTPASVVAIDPDAADRPFAQRTIIATLTDVMGDAIDGTVSWQMYGPAGVAEQVPNVGVATTRGKATLPVTDLGTPGPEGMRVRAPWATSTLPLLTAFDLSKSTSIDLGGGNLGGNPSCAIRGHLGKPLTAVCLDGLGIGQHRNIIEISWTNNAWTKTTHPVPITVQNLFGIVVDRDGSADEPVYAIGADASGSGSWYKLDTAGAGTAEQFDGPIQKIVYIPKCSGQASIVAVSSGLVNAVSTVRFFTPSGLGNIAAPMLTDLASGGCVSDVDTSVHQAIVATQATGAILGDPSLFVLTGTAAQSQAIPIKKSAGTGFITTETGEQRFVGTRLEAEGTVVFEAVLVKQGQTFGLVERAELAAAAPPNTIISGKLDADGGVDLVWDITIPLTKRKLFQVSLSEQVLGTPLTAITSGSPTTGISDTVDFVVGDINMHGTDEVLLFTSNAATIYSPDQ